MAKPPIELSGTVLAQFDGKYMVSFRVAGLTRDDANVVSAILRPLISEAVAAKVLAKRGTILPAAEPGKPH